jgi:S-adenosyl-L-methionine hydrolase (adenosine-forming)
MASPIITLTTDFGQSDYDAGVLSGVIWSIAPQARIVELSHAIERHNVFEAALLLERCTPYFPPGTIHVVVVDPGVGTQRRGLAACLGDLCFVGPDNGVLTPLLERARSLGGPVEIVDLDQPRFWLPNVSAIFHGRDVFASVAAHLANGVRLSELGSPVTDPVRLEFPQPHRHTRGWRGSVLHVDAFGNLSTNLDHTHVPANSRVTVKIADAQIDGIAATFGDGKPGQLVALFDSAGKLCISVVNGNAASRLQVGVGVPLEVSITDER